MIYMSTSLRKYIFYTISAFYSILFVAILKIIVFYILDISEFRVVVSVAVPAQERCSVRLYLQLFVVGLMSYLRYLYLFALSGVHHIVCCVFLCLVYPCCQFFWVVNFCLPFRYSLMFIYLNRGGMLLQYCKVFYCSK